MTTVDQPVRLDDPNLDLFAALSRLSIRQREILVDYYVLHQTPSQIGKRLGITSGAVNSHLMAAKSKLRKEFNEYYED